jgi:hypothetical protein
LIARTDEDITVRVSDEGGGIPRRQLGRVFSFSHSTATAKHGEKDVPLLAGWGLGLPLSQTTARYFGGDVTLCSVPGFGTDAYLHLNLDAGEHLVQAAYDAEGKAGGWDVSGAGGQGPLLGALVAENPGVPPGGDNDSEHEFLN